MNFFSKSLWMAPAAFCAVLLHRNGPGAHFGFAGGEKRHQAQQRVGRRDQPFQPGFLQAVAGQILARFFGRQLGQLGFDLAADRGDGGVACGRPADLCDTLLRSRAAARRLLRRYSARTASASARETGSRESASLRRASDRECAAQCSARASPCSVPAARTRDPAPGS